MKSLNKILLGFVFLTYIGAAPAMAKTNGILIVGTQTEVQNILEGSKLTPTFSTVDADALVAVSLTKGEMAVYEGESVDSIIDVIGEVVKGGMVITLKVASTLWHVLKEVTPFVVTSCEYAIKAAIWVLTHTTSVVVDGVTWTVKTAAAILGVVGQLMQCVLFGCA